MYEIVVEFPYMTSSNPDELASLILISSRRKL